MLAAHCRQRIAGLKVPRRIGLRAGRLPSRRPARSSSGTCANRTGPATNSTQEANHAQHDVDVPLSVRHISEHGRTTYADSEVVTNEADGVRRIEFGALAKRVDQLAAGRRRLGVEPGDRVRPSPGTPRSTRRRTSPSPARAR